MKFNYVTIESAEFQLFLYGPRPLLIQCADQKFIRILFRCCLDGENRYFTFAESGRLRHAAVLHGPLVRIIIRKAKKFDIVRIHQPCRGFAHLACSCDYNLFHNKIGRAHV